MQQTKLVSFIEACINTFIGFWVSFSVWPLVAILTGIKYNFTQHWQIIAIFTFFSVARGYLIRRFFNAGIHMEATKIAGQILKWRKR